MSSISLDQVNYSVLHKQHLTDDSKTDDIVQIVKDISGLHATNPLSPYLSLLARMRNFRKEDLKEELSTTRGLAKIRCVRRTIYILSKDMLPAMYGATKKLVQPLSKDYLKHMGVAPEKYQELSTRVLKLLEGKGMTTQEIKKALRIEVNVSPVINLMCDQALLIRGVAKAGWKSNNHTYYCFDEYFPDVDLNVMDETEAKTAVVRHYLASFGPVTENDIVWWTGLRRTDVQRALGHMAEEMRTTRITELPGDLLVLQPDEKRLTAAEDTRSRTINLLPSLDPYLMGYKERERYLDLKRYEYIFDRSGNVTSTILLDGKIIGVWDFAEEAEPSVKLFLFEESEEDISEGIYSEAQRIGKFITGREVQIRACDAMIPLTRRPAGTVMSPLRGC